MIREDIPTKSVQFDLSYQNHQINLLEGTRLAEMGQMISYQKFLDHLAPHPPPAFDLNVTMESLRSGVDSALRSSNGSD